MWRRMIFICVTVTTTIADGDGDSKLVRIDSGQVRGYRDPDGDIFSFYGIPYATAPIGRNKFKGPLPAPVWFQPIDAVDRGIICPQVSISIALFYNMSMQEDCLVTNVFVPDTDDTKLPVVVLVHGGGFQMGHGNWYTIKNLMRTKKMIVVTFNYRLGIHGFLCLGTKNVPGNAGMKDQVALLRWVKRNIAEFNGNPEDITISGYSAGGASVDLLLLSKASRGLFNKVIVESGSHLAPFTVQRDSIENAKYYARRLNFTNTDDLFALEDFFTNAPFDELTMDFSAERADSAFVFSPCVERYLDEEMFLEDDPVNILTKGKYTQVPSLYGFANMEGLLLLGFFDHRKTKMNENFADFLPPDLQFKNDNERQNMAKKVKDFYFGGKPVTNENILSYIDYFTDSLFVYPILRSVKLQIEKGHDKIYLYEYSFVDDSIPVVPHTNVRGATHCAQTMAVVDGNNMLDLGETNITQEFRQMKLTMRQFWSNFITAGSPVPDGSSLPAWPPVRVNRSPHMSIGQTLGLKTSVLEQRMRFWDDIYDKYYRPAYAPSTPSHRHSEL